MMYPPCTLYVMQCRTPRTWYVGTTLREKHRRFGEHFEGKGCKWTGRHGCRRVALSFPVSRAEASRLENEVWMHYARIYGPERVRGGDVTIVQHDDSIPDWCLPEEFGGNRRVNWG